MLSLRVSPRVVDEFQSVVIRPSGMDGIGRASDSATRQRWAFERPPPVTIDGGEATERMMVWLRCRVRSLFVFPLPVESLYFAPCYSKFLALDNAPTFGVFEGYADQLLVPSVRIRHEDSLADWISHHSSGCSRSGFRPSGQSRSRGRGSVERERDDHFAKLPSNVPSPRRLSVPQIRPDLTL